MDRTQQTERDARTKRTARTERAALPERTARTERAAFAGATLAALVAAAVVACLAAPAAAQDLSNVPAAFVDVGTGAREMGMGGAAVASSRGATAVFWNPARLVASDAETELAATYGNEMGLVPYSAVAGSRRFGERWAFGLGIVYSGDEVLSEMTGLLCAAREFEGLPWAPEARVAAGLAVRTRWASYGDNESSELQVTGSALGAALDLGATVQITERARVGVVGRDLVGVLNWDSSTSGSYEEGVPPALVAGLALELTDAMLVEVDLDKALRIECRDLVSIGGELEVFGVAALRAGYRKALEPHDYEEYSVGGGATVVAGRTDITLDVAYVFGRLENTLRLGLGFAF